ncbi:unnamed protein product [Larinioides sclopetarius]|uniref:Uncharacterized protein n=1 Tax=Larinioides sclopetarius TaxID=280406 RepID=A0AAV2A1V8_9ARAC
MTSPPSRKEAHCGKCPGRHSTLPIVLDSSSQRVVPPFCHAPFRTEAPCGIFLEEFLNERREDADHQKRRQSSRQRKHREGIEHERSPRIQIHLRQPDRFRIELGGGGPQRSPQDDPAAEALLSPVPEWRGRVCGCPALVDTLPTPSLSVHAKLDELTTNMEIKSTQLSTSVLFGIADDNGAHLASLEMANGTSSWNRSTDNILKNVFCDLDSFGDGTVNIPDCIVTAYNYIGAFNASNGTLLWERNITGPSDMTIRKVALAGKPSTGPLVMAISDEEMFLLMAENGTLISTLDLPCSWTLGLKLVGPWAAENVTAWTLVCEYGDSFEVWTFLEEEVLSLSEDFDEGPFRLLFSRGSGNSGSIDLAGDVTRTPNFLALSWADSVVMVTDQAPFHHLQKSWERRFGDTSAVTSIVSGHFTNPKEIQFANPLNPFRRRMPSGGTPDFTRFSAI